MKYLSVCSGIEAATVAWHSLGWEPVAFSEIEPFPAAVLAHHYPNVPNWGDMTKYKEWPDATIDLLVGGTPCQSFSVAGLRKGLDDPRGNLMLTYLAIAHKYRPQWVVWENVPGVLSSNGGRDFAALLRGLEECGYGVAYRVLDAQFVRTHKHRRAVPQRRRRVFVVGCLGSWQRAASVLFERHSLQGNPAPSRKAGEEITGGVNRSLTSRYDSSEDGTGRGLELIPEVAKAVRTMSGGIDREDSHTLICNPVSPTVTNGPPFSRTGNERVECDALVIARESGQGYWVRDEIAGTIDANMGCSGHSSRPAIIAMAHGQANAEIGIQRSPALTCNHEAPIVAYALAENTIGRQDHNGGNGTGFSEELSYTLNATGTHAVCVAPTLTASNDPSRSPQSSEVTKQVEAVVNASMQVRRLTPTECERLQGFPDSYTNIPWRGKPTAPDGPRYKALGNSFATNVVEWIGHRIQLVEVVHNEIPEG